MCREEDGGDYQRRKGWWRTQTLSKENCATEEGVGSSGWVDRKGCCLVFVVEGYAGYVCVCRDIYN